MSVGVLVTGGAGFIGSAVVERLRRDGCDARAGVRRKGAGGPSAPCDLDDPGQTAAALAGVDVVVHAAYGDEAAMERQCSILLGAMVEAGVRRLIYFSSIAVYGEAAGLVTEETPAAPLDAYGAAKVACERHVEAWTSAGGGAAMILRPGVVYGRGSPFWVDKLALRIRSGAWGDFGAAGEGIAPLVHVDDVAEVVARALARPAAGASGSPVVAANLAGPQTPTWNAYFGALAGALGAPPLKALDATTLAWRRRAAWPAKLWRKAGLPGFARAALAPTTGEMALFARKADYRSEACARLTGFTPGVTMTEGLRRSVG